MKIAIIAPSPVPFTIGGAENLFWGLQQYINDATPHQCELLKLASREHGFKDLLQTYLDFSRLDLSHFDLVISTKYPAWMVSHPNHACYMLHKLRGLYDTYHYTGLEDCPWQGAALAEAQRLMDEAARTPRSNQGVQGLLEYLLMLKAADVPAGTFDFPGPVIRRIIHFLDAMALAECRIVRYAAISNNVRNRAEYFPARAAVDVAYPPPKLSSFECGAQDYLFTASRLDGPKRISLLVEAMRHVHAAIPLYIAGTGPDEQRVKTLAAGDARIRFLGFVSDRDMLGWYKDALAVPFVPYDEDYGLITIEAMMSGKPVLTLLDSGGPNEFVENGTTGFSVAPEPTAIAAGIDALCANREAAREMGRNARERVSEIRWAKVVETLLGEKNNFARKRQERRPRLAVALTFPVYPPRGGGQSRAFHLYRNLARYADVELVTSCEPSHLPFRGEIAPGLVETRVPRTQAHHEAENKYRESLGVLQITDVVMSELYWLTPDFVAALRTACARADTVVASHPYLAGALEEHAPGKPLWFEAQDIEFTLKRTILPATPAGEKILERVRQDEQNCWKKAALVFACTQQDIGELLYLYGPTAARTLEVPNGVAMEDVPYTRLSERNALSARIGLGGGKAVLFMGSWHEPNLTAMEKIMDCARLLPDVNFLIVGSVCWALVDVAMPENVKMMGVVEDAEKAVLLGAVDFCINPMTTGSGSNLKMLDYFASGTPVISTEFGARGIAVTAGAHFLQAESDGFAGAIRDACRMAEAELQTVTDRARAIVESEYSWSCIADRFVEASGLLASGQNARLVTTDRSVELSSREIMRS